MTVKVKPINSSNLIENKKFRSASADQTQSQSMDTIPSSTPPSNSNSTRQPKEPNADLKYSKYAHDSHPSTLSSSIQNELRTAGLQATAESGAKQSDHRIHSRPSQKQFHQKHQHMNLQAGSFDSHEKQLQSDQQSITPILIALLPSILSTVTGHSWMEYCLFALVLFYLYMILKVPGDLLIQTRSKAISSFSTQNETLFKAWKKRESLALAMYSLSPILGGLGLYYIQILLPAATLLRHFSASLFFLCAFVKPFLYLTGLVKDSILVEIPSSNSDTYFEPKGVLQLEKCSQQIILLEKRIQYLEENFDERVEEKCKLVMEPLAKTLYFCKKDRKRDAEAIQSLHLQIENQQTASLKSNHEIQLQRSDLDLVHSTDLESNAIDQKPVASLAVSGTNSEIDAIISAEKSLAITTALGEEMKAITSLTNDLCEKISLLEYRLDTSQEELYEFQNESQEQVRNISKLVQIYHGDVQGYLSSTLTSFSLAKQSRAATSAPPSSTLFKIVKSFFDLTLVPILQIPLFFYCLVFGEEYPTLSTKSSPSTPQDQISKPFTSLDSFLLPPPPIPPVLSIPFPTTSFAIPATSKDQSIRSQRRFSDQC